MARRWADVAELVATQGLKGRLVARPVRGLPFLLEEGMPVSFVPPTIDGPRHVRVKAVQHAGGGDYLVDFKGVKNLDQAQLAVGSHCLVACEHLPENFEDLALADYDYLVGYTVRDVASDFAGEIVEVREMPMQDLLVVVPCGADESEEVFIPLVEDLVVDVLEAEEELVMDLPCGLVELNQVSDAGEEDEERGDA